MIDFEITIQGESLVLMPERTLVISRTNTLVAADIHLGKDTSFRVAGIPIPGGPTEDSLSRLSLALTRSGARRLIILGDLVHARSSLQSRTIETVAAWREEHSKIEMILIPGNHDARSGALPNEWRIENRQEDLIEGVFAFRHHPEPSPDGYTLAGHTHPSLLLTGRGKLKERIPCFVFRAEYGILPAFGAFTGTFTMTPEPDDRIFAISPDQVIPLT